MRHFIILIIIFFLLIPIKTKAVEINALVDRNTTSLGESIQLSVSIQGKKGIIDTSSIKDFKVIPRGSSTSMQIINGRTSREIIYNYTLIPLRAGGLKIPPLSISIGKKTQLTREIKIQVSQRPKADDQGRPVFVEANLSAPTVYVGQQLIYTFKFLHAIQITNARFQPPEFNGFAAREVEKRNSYQTIINGRQYMITELYFTLSPLISGVKTIEPAVLECDIPVSRRRRNQSPFDSFLNDAFFSRREIDSKIFRTDPIQIKVKQLPPYKDKTPFSGLVGSFKIQAGLEKQSIKVGDSITLALTISGTGNIMDAKAPDIEMPADFKIYKDAPQENIKLSKKGYSGEKIFRSALVPIKQGTYIIPSVLLTFFDPAASRYKTMETRQFELKVNPAENSDQEKISSFPKRDKTPQKDKVQFTGRDILPLKTDLSALKNQTPMSVVWFAILILMPAGCVSLLIIGLKISSKGKDQTGFMVGRALKALKQAKTKELSDQKFTSLLYQSLTSIIFARAGTNGELLTCREARDILNKAGYSEKITEDAVQLLEMIELNRYSGVEITSLAKKQLLAQTIRLVRSLSK